VFGLSFTEVVIIAILALLLLGPDQLPNAARSAGKWLRELRRLSDDLKDQIETEIYLDERKPRPSLVPPVASTQLPPPAAPLPAAAEGGPGRGSAPAEPAATSTGEGSPDPAPHA
jgi:sec-independent protein translocase protein TatB